MRDADSASQALTRQTLFNRACQLIAQGDISTARLTLQNLRRQAYPAIIIEALEEEISRVIQERRQESGGLGCEALLHYACTDSLYPISGQASAERICRLQALVDRDNPTPPEKPTRKYHSLLPTADGQSIPPGVPEWLQKAERLGFFNEAFYRATNPDLGEDSDVRSHFAQHSYNEPHRNPSQHFSVKKYYETYQDVYHAGVNALEHYIVHGHDRVAFPADYFDDQLRKYDYALDIELTRIPETFSLSSYRIALVLHAFYPDVLRDVSPYLQTLPSELDILITTTSAEKAREIQDIVSQSEIAASCSVRVYSENRGRDIGAFFNEFQDVLSEYDYVGKVHMKKSPHLKDFGSKWSQYLLRSTVGTMTLLKQVIYMMSQCERIGILAPAPFAGTTNNTWDANYDVAIELCRRLGIADEELPSPADLRYPSATVFWFRPAAFQGFAEQISPDFFPEEPLPIDGTSAHAMERLLPTLAKANGLETVFYKVPSLIMENSEEWKIFDWLRDSKAEECYLIISHDASNTGGPRTALAVQRELSQLDEVDCLVILLQGGPLQADFECSGDTICFNNNISMENLGDVLRYSPRRLTVIGNTVISSVIGRLAREYGHMHIALVHEYAKTGYWPKQFFRDSLEADVSIFPGQSIVAEAVSYSGSYPTGDVLLKPQGIYDRSYPHVSPAAAYQSVREELGLNNNTQIIVGCGMIEQRKGVDLFVQTAKTFHEKYSEEINSPVVFVWVGGVPIHEGDSRAWAQSFVQALQNDSPSNVFFLGSCLRTDRYFAASDIFYLSSRQDPFPGVVLEAMACGKPIVCFEGCTDVNQAFMHEIGGVVTEAFNVDSAALSLLNILKNASQRRSMGIWNRKRIDGHFNFTEYVETLRTASNKFYSMQAELGYQSQHEHLLVSVITPAYQTPLAYLQELIASLQRQSYPHWELCISHCEMSPESIAYLAGISTSDARIKLVAQQKKTGIAANTNAALAISSGDIVIFVDHDDTLPSYCIEQLIRHFELTGSDFVYTAEDKMDASGRRFFAPVRKPEFSEEQIIVNNFVTHITAVHRSLLERIGNFNEKYDGAQDYDFVLRACQAANHISYLDMVLYHWRVFENSTSSGDASVKPYAVESGRQALLDYFARLGRTDVDVREGSIAFTYEVVSQS